MSGHGKVLIVGGGLGGLALAQGLRKQGIPHEIFERDEDPVARSQGWALSLHWILNDLLGLVPDDMPFFDQVSLGYQHGIDAEFAYYDAMTGKEQMRLSHSKEKPFLRSDRGKVRMWLMHNLNIQWGKRFVRYLEDPTGVTAFFEDGTFARGDMLIGADGVNSTVREQLMKSAGLKPRAIPLGNITAVVDLNKEQYLQQFQLAHSFYLAHSTNHRLFVGLRSISQDQQTASFYWRFSWFDEEAKNQPYWTVDATQDELIRYARDNTKSFHPTMTEALRATPASGVVVPSLTFWDMLPVPLPIGRVTLLGDAIHPMSPFRGEGANHAMKDGLNLAKCLAEQPGETEVSEILKLYEKEMLVRGSEGVLKSRDAAEDHKQATDNGSGEDDKGWLAARIMKQAGDYGFKRS